MRSFAQQRIPLAKKQTCGKCDRFQDEGCHELKLQPELFVSINVHPQSTKSESTVAGKILTASYSIKLINIHDRTNPTTLFPHLTSLGSLGPADRFLAGLNVYCGLKYTCGKSTGRFKVLGGLKEKQILISPQVAERLVVRKSSTVRLTRDCFKSLVSLL